MASPRAASRPSGLDDLDDLFNYDVDDENDPFSDNYKPTIPIDTAREPTSKSSKNATGLGIDEEVEVTKKIRAPRVKLDEQRYAFEAEFILGDANSFKDSYQQPEYLNCDGEQRTISNLRARGTR
jgi:hypothetical protein